MASNYNASSKQRKRDSVSYSDEDADDEEFIGKTIKIKNSKFDSDSDSEYDKQKPNEGPESKKIQIIIRIWESLTRTATLI